MNARAWIAAALLVPAAAIGGRVVVDPPRPWEGDPVRILIQLEWPATASARPELLADGIALMDMRLDRSERGRDLLHVQGFATGREIVLHSGEYHSERRLREPIPVIRIPVVPLPVDPGDPIRSFDALRRSGKSPVLFEAVAPERRPIAGELVRIEWRAVWTADTQAGDFKLASTKHNVWVREVEGAGEVRLQQGERRNHSIALAGSPVTAQTLYFTTFVAPAPGVYVVPPIDFMGRDRGTEPETVLRHSPPLTVEIGVAPPAAQGLAVGKFRLECHPYGLELWPAVRVGIEGTGNLDRGTGPRLAAKTPYAVVIRRVEPEIDQLGRSRAAAIFSAHARGAELQLPDIVLPYFDPAERRVVEARCTPPRTGSPRAPSNESATTPPPATVVASLAAIHPALAETVALSILLAAIALAALAIRR